MLLKSIIFAGAVHGLFLILLLRSKNRNTQPDYWLMLWLVLLSIQLFFYYDSQDTNLFAEGTSGIIAFSIPLLSAPILFQYICSLSFGKNIGYKRLVIYFVPWFAYTFVTVGIKPIYLTYGYSTSIPY